MPPSLQSPGRLLHAKSASSNTAAVTIIDSAYLVITVTPRRSGLPGKCPPGGSRGAVGQRLAATLLRSFRKANTRFGRSTLKPLQCWEKPGLLDQLFDPKLPKHAYWIFKAQRWPWSLELGLDMLNGDHTFAFVQGDQRWFPRNSSCYAGKDLLENAERIDRPNFAALKGWCSVQNRAGRQALGLHMIYMTEASPNEPKTCLDGLWNAAESGVDCGAPCKDKACSLGEGCADDRDCANGVGCDVTQFKPLPASSTNAGFFPFGGIGTCAERCASFVCPSGQVPDARYASLFCGADPTVNGGKCDGNVYADPTKSCCVTTSPCSAINTCDLTKTYPDPNPDKRCSNIGCTGSNDNATCCLSKASCSSAFTQDACTKLNETLIFNVDGTCASGACNATSPVDKATCCVPPASCGSFFNSSEVCKLNDPSGVGSEVTYGIVGAATPCAGIKCTVTQDWSTCCTAKAACTTGFFDKGFNCTDGTSRRNDTAAVCASRTCLKTDASNCCVGATLRTCQEWQTGKPTACAAGNYGTVVANATALSCGASDRNCIVMCCSSVGTPQTCDQLRVATPTFCGGNGTAFARPPLYPQCSLAVSGSCDEACCPK